MLPAKRIRSLTGAVDAGGARFVYLGRLAAFWRVTLPHIRGTVVVVVTTLIVTVLKVYDIVKAMTNGEFGTSVIANQMFQEAFIARDLGKGSALAVLLFLAVLPLMALNVARARRDD